MKNIIAVFLLLAFAILQGHAQNFILAGQVSGEYVHYLDYEPDSIADANVLPEPYSFYLDVDNDEINDLSFNITYDEGEFDLWFWNKVTILNDSLDIIKVPNKNWVHELGINDTISESQNWSDPSTNQLLLLSFLYRWHPPPEEYFENGDFHSGYLGFKIKYPAETVYGWIHIESTCSVWGMDVTIIVKEVAIRGTTVGITKSEQSTEQIVLGPNPCSDKLFIELKTQPSEELMFDIFDLFGNYIHSGELSSNRNAIKTSSYSPGIYFIVIAKENEIIKRLKFIKMDY